MISLEALSKHIADKKWPPVESWNPDFCGDLDLIIKKNGDWLYRGTIINRTEMVMLFASVLKREGNDYFLVTPVEKVGIKVEQTPYVVVEAMLLERVWVLKNNLGDKVVLSSQHPLKVGLDGVPCVLWRSDIPARVNQNVFYELQMHAVEMTVGLNSKNSNEVWLHSGEDRFYLGRAD